MCGLGFVRFLSAVVLSFVVFAANGAAQEALESPEEKALRKASENLDDYLLSMQSIGDFAVFYSGSESQVLSEQQFSGTFPFSGFRAVRFPKDEEKIKERFWSISTRTTMPSMMSGFAYDELKVGDDRWFTEAAGQTRKYKPDPNRPFSYTFIHLDPRVSVLCSCGAVAKGLSSEPRSYRHFNQMNLLRARESLKGTEAIFSDVGPFWYHVLFDKTQGYMPSRVALTDVGTSLSDDNSNVKLINRMRWKRSGDDTWLPEYGENIDYFGETPGTYDRIKRVSYRVVWISQDELPDDTFSVDNLSSVPGIRMTSAEKWLKMANAIKPIDEHSSANIDK